MPQSHPSGAPLTFPRSPRRIIVLGRAGAGKSMVTRAICRALDLPAIHLDALYWLPGWVPCEHALFRERIEAAIAGDGWVVDGTYSFTLEWTLPRAELVIWVDCPRHVAMRRLLGRAWYPAAGPRADAAPGCSHRVDDEFLRRAWAFDLGHRQMIQRRLDRFGPDVPRIRFGHRARLDRLVERLR